MLFEVSHYRQAGVLVVLVWSAVIASPRVGMAQPDATLEAAQPSAAVLQSTDPQSSPIRQGPQPLRASEHGVGRLIPDLAFSDLSGDAHRLGDYQDHQAIVVAMTGTGCPLCLKYTPSLAAIEDQYRDRNVAFLWINPNDSENAERMHQAVTAHGLDGLCVSDGEMTIPRALGATTTTEVFVLDAARTLVYRGAVDDQYGFGYALDAPRKNYLKDALEAVLSNQQPEIAATSAPGCELYYQQQESPKAAPEVTYHNQVSRIIQANCIECHRAGGIAPNPLQNYQQVTDYAGMIRSVVQRGLMPPWFAAALPTSDQPQDSLPQNSSPHWANDRSLSAADKADLLAWVQAGAPEGDPQDAPVPRTFPGGWLIGQPDVVFGFDRPVQVKATGTMPYQYMTVETDLPEDKWVQAIEVRPGDRRVVHHVIVSLVTDANTDQGNEGDPAAEERAGYWGVYVPGNSTLTYPDGYGKLLPRGAKLRFQMHYTPNGTATEDLTQIGLVFAKQPPRHEVRAAGIINTKIHIPPGAENHEETAEITLPHDVQLLGFLPHMHLRGKAARYEALTAEGTRMLLDIPRYDFNWQLLYRLSKPLPLERGDTIRFTAWFDNSENNPANPDPTRTVRWGPQTNDEMHLGYVEYVLPSARRTDSVRPAPATGAVVEAGQGRLFRRLDVDADGFITRAEVRKRLPDRRAADGDLFDRLDQDSNGKLDESELAQLSRLRRR